MTSSVSREQWRKTTLAAMANYIDAGSIVARRRRVAAVGEAVRVRGRLRLAARRHMPASWTLISETAPANARGRLAGLASAVVHRRDRAAAARHRLARPRRVDAADPVRAAVR